MLLLQIINQFFKILKMHYAFVLPVKNEENTIKEIIEKIILKLKSNNKLSF